MQNQGDFIMDISVIDDKVRARSSSWQAKRDMETLEYIHVELAS